MSTTRRLNVIAVSDVVGYARLLNADETGTLVTLEEPWSEVGPTRKSATS